jgi:hypothetical protein
MWQPWRPEGLNEVAEMRTKQSPSFLPSHSANYLLYGRRLKGRCITCIVMQINFKLFASVCTLVLHSVLILISFHRLMHHYRSHYHIARIWEIGPLRPSRSIGPRLGPMQRATGSSVQRIYRDFYFHTRPDRATWAAAQNKCVDPSRSVLVLGHPITLVFSSSIVPSNMSSNFCGMHRWTIIFFLQGISIKPPAWCFSGQH